MKTNQNISNLISNKLTEIEESEGVRILHAVESGSRAWGFPSPDSDYDVRFIYVRPVDYYLRLEKTRDVIEWQLDETLDINGWDLQKAFRLLHGSNPTFFEWNQSPIVYRSTDLWTRMQGEFDRFFLLKPGLCHYLNMATNNFKDSPKGDEVKLKKYFYVLRPLLACRWILHQKSPSPMLFSELVEAELDRELVPFLDDLLQRKMISSELGVGARIPQLDAYIETSFAELDEIIRSLPRERKPDWSDLNALFRDILLRCDTPR